MLCLGHDRGLREPHQAVARTQLRIQDNVNNNSLRHRMLVLDNTGPTSATGRGSIHFLSCRGGRVKMSSVVLDGVTPHRQRLGVTRVGGPEPDDPVDKITGTLPNRVRRTTRQLGKDPCLLD
jgi:hypothetical protein